MFSVQGKGASIGTCLNKKNELRYGARFRVVLNLLG